MFKKSFMILLAGVVLFLGACSAQSGQNSPETEPIPEAGQNTGVIYGYLLDTQKQPIQDTIYLSQDIAHDNPELPPTISFSLQSDPRGRINTDTGFFYFDNVTPADNYVITIFIGAGEPFTVRDEDPMMPLFIEVEAGESVNLGEIIVDFDL